MTTTPMITTTIDPETCMLNIFTVCLAQINLAQICTEQTHNLKSKTFYLTTIH